jgi:hypothetical protein
VAGVKLVRGRSRFKPRRRKYFDWRAGECYHLRHKREGPNPKAKACPFLNSGCLTSLCWLTPDRSVHLREFRFVLRFIE